MPHIESVEDHYCDRLWPEWPHSRQAPKKSKNSHCYHCHHPIIFFPWKWKMKNYNQYIWTTNHCIETICRNQFTTVPAFFAIYMTPVTQYLPLGNQENQLGWRVSTRATVGKTLAGYKRGRPLPVLPRIRPSLPRGTLRVPTYGVPSQ